MLRCSLAILSRLGSVPQFDPKLKIPLSSLWKLQQTSAAACSSQPPTQRTWKVWRILWPRQTATRGLVSSKWWLQLYFSFWWFWWYGRWVFFQSTCAVQPVHDHGSYCHCYFSFNSKLSQANRKFWTCDLAAVLLPDWTGLKTITASLEQLQWTSMFWNYWPVLSPHVTCQVWTHVRLLLLLPQLPVSASTVRQGRSLITELESAVRIRIRHQNSDLI